MNKPKDVDEYIGSFPAGVQQKLQQVRNAIKKAAPHAKEIISYSMPAYKQHGNLVYFGGWENHVGFYPGAGAIVQFKNDLAAYKGAKGSVQFPLDEPMPLSLIAKIVAYRVKEDAGHAETKRLKKAK
ncbi:hypothetical protein EWM62_12805 [Mucilaginibacter terrigena]|uniref:YdhG-like domain-containing protein n=1 Tax=Mucilaginibacter terrigena TaxID=2492395 RepID=A0A4Q5LKP2_9SPHI|nr:DUF1801 domain-containing protein [Mucilaginibacter terrigena]RYU89212.1 hypothetical protein EWM62_12805 [Mucilaginibacter terrigena]